jgi:hypothetical protein
VPIRSVQVCAIFNCSISYQIHSRNFLINYVALHATARDTRRLCRDPRGWVVTTRSTGTISVVIWPCLLLLHLTPHNNHRLASSRSKALNTIERHPTGICGRRLRREDQHVLHGIADLCDLCILIICINIRIRHIWSLYETYIFVSMFARLIVLLADNVWNSLYYYPMMYETHCTTTRWCMRHTYI